MLQLLAAAVLRVEPMSVLITKSNCFHMSLTPQSANLVLEVIGSIL
jgi:hypothetical protein